LAGLFNVWIDRTLLSCQRVGDWLSDFTIPLRGVTGEVTTLSTCGSVTPNMLYVSYYLTIERGIVHFGLEVREIPYRKLL
jgi:hypothetical protein